MSGILSSISGQFSKSLILGTLLPAAFFVALSLVFVAPLLPADGTLLKAVAALDAQWKVVSISLVTLALSGALYNLNIPIIRLYEGYPWRESGLGKCWVGHYKAEVRALQARRDGATALLRTNFNEAVLAQIQPLRDKLWWQIVKEFPGNDLILPTRLGNTIRSFEYYANREYGMDAVTLWPRLIASVGKDYAAVIDDAKTGFDFMINSSVLSAVLGALILLMGTANAGPLAALNTAVPWMLEVVGCVVFFYIFYVAAISAASDWGDLVKGAFDLFRRDLLKQLGYSTTFSTRREERDQWEAISRQMIYGDFPLTVLPPPATIATYARGTPSSAPLEVARAVELEDTSVRIVLRVKNPDHVWVDGVVVTDTLPADYFLEWSSPCLYGRPVRYLGSNPYHFQIGRLAPNTGVTLRYRAIPLSGRGKPET